MSEDQKDSADHLVAAARAGSGEGMTREQFVFAAATFWDSWHSARSAIVGRSHHPCCGFPSDGPHNSSCTFGG